MLLVGDDEALPPHDLELFAGQGFPTRTAFDPRTAIARVGNSHADVVVCDLGATRLQSIATVLAAPARRRRAADRRGVGDAQPRPALPRAAGRHFIPQPFRFSRLRELVERAPAAAAALTGDSGVFLREQAEQILDELPTSTPSTSADRPLEHRARPPRRRPAAPVAERLAIQSACVTR